MPQKPKEKILKIETIFNGNIINLQKRTIKLQSGITIQREIIKHPGSAAIIPLIDNETIILIEQYRSALGKVILEIPAGTLEHDEQPVDCAKRELLEETGYQATNFRELLVNYTTPGYSDEKMYFYLATDLIHKEQKLERDENIRTRKIKLDEINLMIKNGEISDMKTICGISRLISE